MNKLRVVVVDDEPLAREKIRTLLGVHTDFEVVCECPGGREAVRYLRKNPCDLLFLDVQMPEVDGFDVLLALDPEDLPHIVFVTAYEQYAVKAFEFHALDYLLKPVTRSRFVQALERVRERSRLPQSEIESADLSGLLQALRKQDAGPERLVFKSEGRLLFLNIDDIEWVESAGNYLKIHVEGEVHLIRETTSAMEGRLPAQSFVRIHRSTIVNLNRIYSLQPLSGGDYQVILKSGQALTLSRRFRQGFEERLGRAL